ncbi:bifunctional hydroxymethylpyrimidine kinase/phosphomethylpyrimidine kinase [Lysinibacillus sp. SGAir0095]|uniref:bifunctional hydroxymethylpyrimidine kinase/phosphomethylpyrimidine kinase n=1 Tax=Lysinibacillus sp. SGAir0095 TaxID=2070463 RepID=UPI0010CD07D5|nr:bifunctional hydroxymethylpyrimidine kinase/phosphomethylpyrimidine kinase [Lysinibacillus sp. SGAir0095]QCR34159.1 bifunctional hydroxymethylpyrimidine kinase/phosphomethylpyrimidine kinase [Lysinibacillus sp. SGAir0095]
MIALSIAGSDSGGGAGIQADVKTFQELGVFGTTAITSLTAQNTLGVHGISEVAPAFLKLQLDAVLSDFNVQAVKTGMLFSAELIEIVADVMKGQNIPLIVDPVMVAKGGASLLQEEAVMALKTKLLPLTTICTPNIPEAETLTGMSICNAKDIELAAKKLLAMGVQYVVMKGGHLAGEFAADTVYWNGGFFTMMTPRVQTKDTHGTGCTFSAAITAGLAKGLTIEEAIIEAKKFIHLAISIPLSIGNGHGPTNHFAYKRANGHCEVIVHES